MKDWIQPSQASAAGQPDVGGDLELTVSAPLAAGLDDALAPAFEAPSPLPFPKASTARTSDQTQGAALLDEEIVGLLATHGRTFHFAARFMPPVWRHDQAFVRRMAQGSSSANLDYKCRRERPARAPPEMPTPLWRA